MCVSRTETRSRVRREMRNAAAWTSAADTRRAEMWRAATSAHMRRTTARMAASAGMATTAAWMSATAAARMSAAAATARLGRQGRAGRRCQYQTHDAGARRDLECRRQARCTLTHDGAFLLIFFIGLFLVSKTPHRPTRSAASATVMLQRTPPHMTTTRVDFDYSTSPRNLSFVVIKRRRRPTLRKSNLPSVLQTPPRTRG